MKKRLLAIALVLCMICTILPTGAFAANLSYELKENHSDQYVVNVGDVVTCMSKSWIEYSVTKNGREIAHGESSENTLHPTIQFQISDTGTYRVFYYLYGIDSTVMQSQGADGNWGYVYVYDKGSYIGSGTLTLTATSCEHSFSAGKTIKAATCTEVGEAELVCSICGYTYIETVPALGHSFNNGEVCTRCGYVHTHSYKSEVVQPTCTAQGYILYTCTICHNTYKNSYTPAIGHSYSASEVAPTCTGKGYTLYTCSRCYDSYREYHTDALGHNYVANVTKPTCTEGGYTTYICSRCHDDYIGSFTDPLGHNYTSDSNGRCTRCGKVQEVIASGSCGNSAYWSLYEDGLLTIYGSGRTSINTQPWKAEKVKSVVVQSGITYLDYSAFSNCSNLETVSLPDTLTALEQGVFSYCTSLRSITLPNSVTRIGTNAFHNCTSLERVTLPDSLTVLGYHAFQGCSSLREIVLPAKTETVGNYAFRDCTSLISITIPGSVKTIGTDAFLNCKNLSTVYYSGAKSQWSKISIASGNGCLQSAELRCDPFDDVQKGSACYNAVLWAYYHEPYQITGGYTATEFRPNNPCTRGQVVTFLWRAAGCPVPTTVDNPFNDVASTAYYYKAILWAAENGITAGYNNPDGSKSFRPGDTVTRAQFVTFLWRYAGKPAPSSTSNPFRDVPQSAFSTAILWGNQNKIVSGYSDGSFKPNNPCTRSHVAMFLYRYMG